MCRTKVNPYFGSKYLGLFLIHSTEGSGYTEMALKVFTMATKRAKKAARKTEERECELIRLLSVEFMTPGSMPSMALGSHYFLFS